MEKISIHRALAELKLLDAKINKGMNNQFIGAKQSSIDKIGGVPVKDIESSIKSDYQSITDLIDRRTKIKSAIMKSNALTEIKICGRTITVAEGIDEKNSIVYKENLLNNLTQKYNKTVAHITKANDEILVKAEDFIQNLYADKSQVDPNKIKELKQDFIDKNKWELIDPLNLKKEIDNLSEYIDNFKMEIDYILSESNSVTFIEV